MNKMTLKTVIWFVTVALLTITLFSCDSENSDNSDKQAGSSKPVNSDKSGDFIVRITDKPLTFCNPLNVAVGSERARRA